MAANSLYSNRSRRDERLPRPSTIAIDGPAGTGKSTISQIIADRYGYIFVDTGAFYRAVTYILLKASVPLDDISAVAALVTEIRLKIDPDETSGYRVTANGEDVTEQLRSKSVEDSVSTVAKMPVVREALLPLQRAVAAQGGIILAGRDIGTVVAPDADLKFYIDASLAERARRRQLQMKEAGKTVDPKTVEAALAERDHADSERSLAPLVRANDAIYVMTDGKSIEVVIEEINQIIDNWRAP